MNWLFGVAITAPPVLFVLYFWWVGAITKEAAWRFSVAYLCVMGFYAGMSYGHRSQLNNPSQTYHPTRSEITESEPIFETERTRIGQFDERLNEEAPEKP